MKKAEITAFLSLIFILLLSFLAGVIESASIQTLKNQKRVDTDRAVDSVFAEYQIELLKQYDIFAVEGTYESGEFADDNILERLSYYEGNSGVHHIEKVQFLTDNGGAAFREQVAEYMRHKLGIGDLGSIEKGIDVIKEQEEDSEKVVLEEQQLTDQITSQLTEVEESLPEEDNPMLNMSNIKQSGLLQVVIPNPEQLSNQKVAVNEMPSGRNLRSGYGVLEEKQESKLLSKIALVEYIFEHFKGFTDDPEETPLSYGLEYILVGKGSDVENLEEVAKRLIAIRFAPNYLYLLSDGSKQTEAEVLAASLCTLLSVPAISELVKQAILLAWAYGESIMDVRSLMSGHKVSVMKTAEDWQLSLSGLLKLGTKEDEQSGKDMEDGLKYQEYLKGLFLLSEETNLTMRSLDLIEANLRGAQKLEFFRVDSCIAKIEFGSTFEFRRGVQYSFNTNYSYN